ncbi:MAG TPA: NADH-quinone oxidoreductase subunit NuoN [Stellaceae bacterium]
MPIEPLPNFLSALPEIFLAVSAMALLLLGVFQGEARAAKEVSWLAVIVCIVAIFMVGAQSGVRHVTFAGLFVTDGYAIFAKILVLVGSAFSIVLSIRYNEREHIARFEFPVLILLTTTGMLMMISANDLLALYVGLELQSLALYIVASFDRDSLRSSEAGLKYFVLGALASGLMLFGISMIYGFTGSTNFDMLALHLNGHGAANIGLVIGMVFLIVGLAFKVSAVPFHMWTPDVYEGAPTPVTAFFSMAPKIAAMALFVRVMVGPFHGMLFEWRQVIWAISVASMVLGALAAINQRNIKRLMAYSSIGHVGYALIGLAAGNAIGVRGILIYLTIYLFMNLGTFAVILSMRRQGKLVEGIDDLAGLSRTQPAMALALGIFMFSLAGIPPLAGFFAKLYIFMAAIDSGLNVLAVIGVVTSVIGAYYYVRIVKVMYFDEPATNSGFDRMGAEVKTVLVIASIVIMFFFLYSAPIVSGAEAASAVLFPG